MLESQVYTSLPEKPGVYLYKNDKGTIIYVGKAKNLKKRVSSYFTKSAHDSKTQRLVAEITSMEHIVVSSEIEAFLLEATLIKKYSPFFNIQFKDDKFYPYIKIGFVELRTNNRSRHSGLTRIQNASNADPGRSQDDNIEKNVSQFLMKIPYIMMTRKLDDKNAEYFGPYTSADNVKTVLKILRRIFPYQSVKNHPKRNCLYYHLGLCPCIPNHPEHLPEYKKAISNIKRFLNGNTTAILKDFEKEQKLYIKEEAFEQAAAVQKKIEQIKFVTSENYDPFRYEEKPDFYFDRIQKEVESLLEILQKEQVPVSRLDRIECYDISNFQGTNPTGSMVVFMHGDADKKEYKRFHIRGKNTPDDFAMHQEMMSRRLNHLEDWGTPDLLVIDGGKGQVSSVLEVLVRKNVNIPVIGLAKREETIVIPETSPLSHGIEFVEVKLPHSTSGVNLLRRIRDEAHRFAITYHRLLRKKNSFR